MWTSLGKYLILWMCFCSLSIGTMAMKPAAFKDKAVKIFEDQCNECHRVSALGLEAMEMEDEDEDEDVEITDLSGVGKKHDTDFLRKWLKREVEMDGEKHEKKFKGSDKELEIMVEWLASLQTKGD